MKDGLFKRVVCVLLLIVCMVSLFMQGFSFADVENGASDDKEAMYTRMISMDDDVIICKDYADLSQVVKKDLTESRVHAIYKSKGNYSTDIIIEIETSDYANFVDGYEKRAWLPHEECLEPIPPGDRRLLERCDFLPSHITDFAYTYGEVEKDGFMRPYMVYFYQYHRSGQEVNSDTCIIVTQVPKEIVLYKIEYNCIPKEGSE